MSDQETRNPYVILGVPAGATSRDANAAFAKMSLKVSQGLSPWKMEDLTWALHQIENDQEDELKKHFRIPANPKVTAPPLLGPRAHTRKGKGNG